MQLIDNRCHEETLAQHLVAIALQTGREKDRCRVRVLVEQAALDMDYCKALELFWQNRPHSLNSTVASANGRRSSAP